MAKQATLRRPTEISLAQAARLLRQGGLVAFPTETVYGLGADATNDHAVARIFAVKNRVRFNPLIVHVGTRAEAEKLAVFNPKALRLADAFWPGPLTIVLPRSADCPVSYLATAGLETIALRIPADPLAQELLTAFGGPIAAPSANPSGRISATSAAHVTSGLGNAVDLVLDGGPCRIGLESTIIGLHGPVPVLLRPGGMPREAVEAVTGPLAAPDPHARPEAPGGLPRHYAPQLPLRLNAEAVAADEGLIAFGPEPLEGAGRMLNLSTRGDLLEAATNLFAHLHALDRDDLAAIAIMPIPEDGLGEAINDRLRRAAQREVA